VFPISLVCHVNTARPRAVNQRRAARRIRVDLDLKRLDRFGDRLHSAISRATIGTMTASLVIGSSIVMAVAEGPTLSVCRCSPFSGLSVTDRVRE
jgi:hypothetical protein